MHDKNNLTENDFDKALAGEKQMTVKLQAARNALGDTRLIAPFDGYVQTCFISQGEIIGAGMQVVALVDVASLKIETSIPARAYIYHDEFQNFYCTNHNYPDQKFSLQLTGVDAKAGTNNLYKLKLKLQPVEGVVLAPGMSVQVNFSYKNPKGTEYKIPLSTCFEKQGKSWTWVYKNGVVKAVQIQLGEIDLNNNVIVTSGLQANDDIVTTGIHSLQDGETVKPLEKKR